MDWGEGALGGEIKVNQEIIVRKEKVNKDIGIGDQTLAGYQNKKGMVEGEEELIFWTIVALNSINHFYISVNLDFVE